MSRPEITAFFAKYIEKELGIVYSDFNAFQLESRLDEIVRSQGLETVDALFELAKKGLSASLRQLVLDTATNNETTFFRDPRVFQAITKAILPRLLTEKAVGEKLRIWSAASSFGQEAYSLAMLLQENHTQFGSRAFEIKGTDIADRALVRARAAKYSQLEVQRGLPTALLLKYFDKGTDDQWTAKSIIRDQATFDRANLLEPFERLGTFDLILCRNVLIYQRVEKKTEIVGRLLKRLNPGGWLVLGAGESLLGISSGFEMIQAEGAVVYRMIATDALTKKVA